MLAKALGMQIMAFVCIMSLFTWNVEAQTGLTDWGTWSQCSKPCELGQKKRTRECSNSSLCGGATTEELEDCNDITCTGDTGLTEWGTWSDCSKTCGTGFQARVRTCTIPSLCSVAETEDYQSCTGFPCPQLTLTDWQDWTACTKSCDLGVQTRTRVCVSLSGCGTAETRQNQTCNDFACPGGESFWESWKPWSDCQSGTRKRTRICNLYGEPSCPLHPDHAFDTEACASDPSTTEATTTTELTTTTEQPTTTTTADPTTTTEQPTTTTTAEPTTTTEQPTTTTTAEPTTSTEQPTTTSTAKPTTTTEQPTTATTTDLTTTTEQPTTTTTAKPTTTTEQTITTTTAEPTTSTEQPTTTTTAEPTTTTEQPTTTTTAEPTTSTEPPTTTTTAQTTTTTEQPTTATTADPTTTTEQPTTTTTAKPTTTTEQPTTTTPSTLNPRIKGSRIRIFSTVLTVEKFEDKSIICVPSQLRDSTTSTYQDIEKYVCGAINKHARKVKTCRVTSIKCGSFIVTTDVSVEQNDGDASADAAAATLSDFEKQLESIVSDKSDVLVVNKIPTAKDVNECDDSSLNSCSPNSNCTNTDGHYTCTCSKDYPQDISQYLDEPGRVCARSCDGYCATASEVCQVQAEAEPVCTCPDGSCGSWIYAVIGAAFLLAVITVVLMLCALKRTGRNVKLDHRVRSPTPAIYRGRSPYGRSSYDPHHSMYRLEEMEATY